MALRHVLRHGLTIIILFSCNRAPPKGAELYCTAAGAHTSLCRRRSVFIPNNLRVRPRSTIDRTTGERDPASLVESGRNLDPLSSFNIWPFDFRSWPSSWRLLIALSAP